MRSDTAPIAQGIEHWPPEPGAKVRILLGAHMPELPEVESARAVIERNALRRRIVDVDDSDGYVCRPHVPGEIRHALLGGELVTAMRQGKSMWCQTDPSLGAVRLGIHLGMSGKIVIA